MRVATIVDEFTHTCLEPEVTLWPLDPRWFRLELAFRQPDFLFVESAWRGYKNRWRGRIAKYPNRSDGALAAVVRMCRKKNIPTVFWNKEDPVHFDRFADAARLFDYVFTTDVGCLQRYVDECGKSPDAVGFLPFAFQPTIYYPKSEPRDDSICFAGSYGEAEFSERRQHLEMLLDACAGRNLAIYDRNADLKNSDKAFPARFQPYIRGAADYKSLADIYRKSRVALNVNSVTGSQTMFSRRVFEMLACGIPVVSSPSSAIKAAFGDIVAMVADPGEARAAIERLFSDADHWQSISQRGIDNVFRAHTYADRLETITRAIGVSSQPASPTPRPSPPAEPRRQPGGFRENRPH